MVGGLLLKSNIEDACTHRALLTTSYKQMANNGGGVLELNFFRTPCFSRWPMKVGVRYWTHSEGWQEGWGPGKKMFAHLTTRYKQMAQGRWGWGTGWGRLPLIARRQRRASSLAREKPAQKAFVAFSTFLPLSNLDWDFCGARAAQYKSYTHPIFSYCDHPLCKANLKLWPLFWECNNNTIPPLGGHGECMSFPISPFRGHVGRPPPHGHICPPT